MNSKHYPKLVALACVIQAVNATAQTGANKQNSFMLEEIVVTATRRETSLSEVPLSIVAMDQQTLDKQGVRSVGDVMRLTPSITFGQGGQYYGTGQTNIAVRGVFSTSGVPTTGVYIDDTPIQSRTGISPSLTNAYPKIFDLDRVEVLRGPQGTLFGTGSMGGAVRFITPDPLKAPTQFYTRTEVNSTENGDMGYELGVAGGTTIIEDVLGVRASIWQQEEGGYVDRLDRVTKTVAKEDVNSESSTVARIALGWQATDSLVITPSVLYQKLDIDDSSLIEVATSDIGDNDYNSSLYAVPQPHEDEYWLPALKVEFDIGDMTLISNTSYFDRETSTVSDDTALNVILWGAYTGSSLPAQFADDRSNTQNATSQKGFTQEIRLQNTDSANGFDWVVGAFYSDMTTKDSFDASDVNLLEHINFGSDFYGATFDSVEAFFGGVGLYQGQYVISQRSKYNDVQKSVFAQVDYELIDRLTLTVGLRYTDATFDFDNFVAGPLYSSNEGIITAVKSNSKDVTPKFGLSFQATDDNLFYASAAQGVRGESVAEPVGSACADDAARIGFDPLTARKVDADSLWSYELGTKNQLMDGRMVLEGSIYHSKWDDVQTNVLLPGCGVNTTLNFGEATIDGADVSLMVRPLQSLTVSAGVSYMHARYTKQIGDVPGVDRVISKGEHLPVAPWSARLSGEYEFALSQREAYVRGDFTHTRRDGKSLDLASVLVDPDIPRTPSTSVLDLRAGMYFDDLEASFFVNNVLNENALLSYGHDNPGAGIYRSTVYRPRTFGLTLTYRK